MTNHHITPNMIEMNLTTGEVRATPVKIKSGDVPDHIQPLLDYVRKHGVEFNPPAEVVGNTGYLVLHPEHMPAPFCYGVDPHGRAYIAIDAIYARDAVLNDATITLFERYVDNSAVWVGGGDFSGYIPSGATAELNCERLLRLLSDGICLWSVCGEGTLKLRDAKNAGQ